MLRSRQAALCCPCGARVAQLIDEERRLKTVHENGAGPLLKNPQGTTFQPARPASYSGLVQFLFIARQSLPIMLNGDDFDPLRFYR